MKYIFFPGNTPEHKEWCESLQATFNTTGSLMIYYDHWKTGGSVVWNTELEKIKRLNIAEECVAVCKSAGCMLSMLAFSKGYLNIKKFVFIGFPYLWLKGRGDDVDSLLKNWTQPSLFIQKPYDPVMPYTSLKILVGKLPKAYTVEYLREGESNDDHSYKDVHYLHDLIVRFVKQN